MAKKRKEQALKEFEEQNEFLKNTEMLSAADRTRLRDKQQLAFMYQKPPGYEAMLEKEKAAAADAKLKEEQDASQAAEAEARRLVGWCTLKPVLKAPGSSA